MVTDVSHGLQKPPLDAPSVRTLSRCRGEPTLAICRRVVERQSSEEGGESYPKGDRGENADRHSLSCHFWAFTATKTEDTYTRF